jgi:hypothetical protein
MPGQVSWLVSSVLIVVQVLPIDRPQSSRQLRPNRLACRKRGRTGETRDQSLCGLVGMRVVVGGV